MILLTGGNGYIGSAISAYLNDVVAPLVHEFNVSDPGMIEAYCRGKTFDALILAHGSYGHFANLKQSPPHLWRRAVETNLIGSATVIHYANVSGQIIVLGGGQGGRIPLPERSSYAASKAGLNALVLTGAAEGLDIYGVAPGPLPSKMQDQLFCMASDAVKDEMTESLKHAVPIERTLAIIDYILSGKATPGRFYSARERCEH